jgi:hypothetical protein
VISVPEMHFTLLAVGSNGNLLMPNSPNTSFQLEYIRTLELFDVINTPSVSSASTIWRSSGDKLGNLPEY